MIGIAVMVTVVLLLRNLRFMNGSIRRHVDARNNGEYHYIECQYKSNNSHTGFSPAKVIQMIMPFLSTGLFNLSAF